ncbi:hypothetical protein GCK72_007648 [Caenorhabditis remanei]|uniref:C2H2-type domain-containing protein n=1 Tax=Caenorhabditis remanei TaxID=31234 RepID=E3M9C0_CAERE|nr:hypothetical protein GCK72_007648 [Caenorhabditis remanei]EFO96218.1 hypothetical protein CRE_14516 [Caenorhabditis remanei]KAF1767689.1 hypothetical protein GCK72_007648 [Caenorhabditis remanei]
MPFRPVDQLKCPELKGDFKCGDCDKSFCHAASMRRHRANFHGDSQKCLLCNSAISSDVRRHMFTEHNIDKTYTCTCCKWSFRTKKELMSHNKSMSNGGVPGEAVAIAINTKKTDKNTISDSEKPASEDDELASFLVDLITCQKSDLTQQPSFDSILATFMKEVAETGSSAPQMPREGSESGIEVSPPTTTETSPSTSAINLAQKTQRSHKRRSLSDICSALVLKKCK